MQLKIFKDLVDMFPDKDLRFVNGEYASNARTLKFYVSENIIFVTILLQIW